MCLLGLLLSWFEPETSPGLQRDTWWKLYSRAVAGQGSERAILEASGYLLTCQCLQTQARYKEAEREQDRSSAQQCWKPHIWCHLCQVWGRPVSQRVSWHRVVQSSSQVLTHLAVSDAQALEPD